MSNYKKIKKYKFGTGKKLPEWNGVEFPNFKREKLEEGLRSVEITYEDGSKLTTSMASGLSDDEIKAYYKVGKEFNLGSGDKDKMTKVKSIKILK